MTLPVNNHYPTEQQQSVNTPSATGSVQLKLVPGGQLRMEVPLTEVSSVTIVDIYRSMV